MSSDTPTQKAVTRALDVLHATLDETLRTLAEEVARVAAEESAREVAREAKSALEAAQRAAEEQIAAAKREAEVEVANACADADRQLADVQEELTERIASLERQLMHVRTTAEDEARTGRFEAEKEHRDLLASAIERAQHDGHQTALASAVRLVESARALDEASSLGDVLHRLAATARLEASRVAVLVLKDNRLQGWSFLGFNGLKEAPGSISLDPKEQGLLGEAVRTGGTAATYVDQTTGHTALALPSFAGSGEGRQAIALPMMVGGSVVALLYADALRSARPTAGSAWTAMVELLARHASRILEAMMVAQSNGVTIPKRTHQTKGEVLPGPVEERGADDAEDAARRYARLLLSEVKLYNEAAVGRGREAGDLLQRLSGEIARARALYESRVPSSLDARDECFDGELVRTLAGGDASKLGAA